ncbi:MAG: hypothetical protein HQ515_19640 [Phycisphaeraceae bacterium]|nr:hypothetical protein [Phycisphaeraceae bacterium]
MEKYICIHGHFYQPPRENPWLEDVELQDSAYPYHDWNARIAEECYRQNAASRVLSSEQKVVDIVNNYERMSFNFGPTLLSWLDSHQPDIYEKILAADRTSRERFSGHGSALAQAYNHMIMPLANPRDKETQVLWGIRDFQKRFGRDPEGMWLPEAAVDLPTLEVLVDHGIEFTILAPRQARRIRRLEARRWRNVNEGQFDTSVRIAVTCRPVVTLSCSFTMPRPRRTSPTAVCFTAVRIWPPVCSSPFPATMARPTWCTRPPTASPSVTTTAMETWPWPIVCDT